MFSFILIGVIVIIIGLIIADYFDKKEAKELYTKSDEAPVPTPTEEVKVEEQAVQQVDEQPVKKPKRKYTRKNTQK